MEPRHISIGSLLQALSAGVIIISITFVMFLVSDAPKIVFCDVGEGDGAYIRTSDKKDIIIDAGPDSKMSRCLSRFMPLFDHTIEMAYISHPQKDHYGGIEEISNHYQIKTLYTHLSYHRSSEFNSLLHNLKEKGTYLTNGFEGDIVDIGNAHIFIIWPSIGYIKHNTSVDPNNYSYVLLFKDRSISALFTGDITPEILLKIHPSRAKILKVPHHGSKNGITSTFLRQVDPTLSIISAGKGNRYNHPSNEIISLFSRLKKNVIRTDERGDIEIKY